MADRRFCDFVTEPTTGARCGLEVERESPALRCVKHAAGVPYAVHVPVYGATGSGTIHVQIGEQRVDLVPGAYVRWDYLTGKWAASSSERPASVEVHFDREVPVRFDYREPAREPLPTEQRRADRRSEAADIALAANLAHERIARRALDEATAARRAREARPLARLREWLAHPLRAGEAVAWAAAALGVGAAALAWIGL